MKIPALILCLTVAVTVPSGSSAGEVRYNRDIRPILSSKCWTCHGPDAGTRKAKLRLDTREGITADLGGRAAAVPGDVENSELIARIRSDDPDEVMPPPKHPKRLTDAEKALLTDWVKQGATFEAHWSFLSPRRPELPAVQRADWPRNAIDKFILARLEKERLQPSPETDKVTLIRRATLDLTGLPPTPAEVDAFVANSSPEAYERVVDRLLSSPRYGERMAVDWLDAARFADTNGYQVDRDREMYAWRDWVIRAFNDNKPFDQFTVEQIAGDLLPNASVDQKIATGFHRNHMLNEEGGIIAEEFLAEYCGDRVETTATVWLGLTFNCARCHDHKYDPLLQKDFYGLYAFFHNVTENGVGNYGANIRQNAPPFLKLSAPETEAKLATIKQELEGVNGRLAAINASLAKNQAEWEQRLKAGPVPWQAAPIQAVRAAAAASLEIDLANQSARVGALTPGRRVVTLSARAPRRLSAVQLEFSALPGPDQKPVPLVLPISELRLFRTVSPADKKPPVAVRAGTIAGSQPVAEVSKALTPKKDVVWNAALGTPVAAVAVLELVEPSSDSGDDVFTLELVLEPKAALAGWQVRVSTTDVSPDLLSTPEVQTIVRKSEAERTPAERKLVTDFRLARNAEHVALTQKAAALSQQIVATDLEIPTTLVMAEMPAPRPTFVLIRGAYDKKGEAVTAATPAALPPMASDLPRNRLGLARWLVDPANPLPARVTVNRYWQSFFGVGLVRTAEDFGSQGEPPSHPELLDWLATEFIRTGWDVKAMQRLMVTSATYRQSSRLTPALHERDPENRLLARGPRFRLGAEIIRDQALFAGGLLGGKIGGPSVRPYHPPGLYEQVVAGSSAGTYVQGKGADLYRRSLYTYWKRSVPHPAMLTFDAPFREMCAVRRSRTSTPLQALNLLNDPTYVEAARFLAQRMVREGGSTPATRIAHGFRLVTARPPRAAELAVLVAGFERLEKGFRGDPTSAAKLLTVGETPADATLDPVHLAAYATVASTILNLDETIVKE